MPNEATKVYETIDSKRRREMAKGADFYSEPANDNYAQGMHNVFPFPHKQSSNYEDDIKEDTQRYQDKITKKKSRLDRRLANYPSKESVHSKEINWFTSLMMRLGAGVLWFGLILPASIMSFIGLYGLVVIYLTPVGTALNFFGLDQETIIGLFAIFWSVQIMGVLIMYIGLYFAYKLQNINPLFGRRGSLWKTITFVLSFILSLFPGLPLLFVFPIIELWQTAVHSYPD